MTIAEFEAVLRGVALRNGAKDVADVPTDAMVLEDLAWDYRRLARLGRTSSTVLH